MEQKKNKGSRLRTCRGKLSTVDGATERQDQLNTCKVVAEAQCGSIQYEDIWRKVTVDEFFQSLNTSQTFTEVNN